MALKLGIIGMSEGNGHPYSWSAICNGYDVRAMADCPFPGIPAYLAERDWPTDRLPEVSVTHIWTQDRKVSEHIAAAARIPSICEELTDMIGAVDALLLARDDPEHHYAMAAPFLEAGLPVYVDKPLATTVAVAEQLYALSAPAQLYSCSALRYATEFQLNEAQRQRLGTVQSVDAVVPKSWEKYAVHVIEPALQLLGNHSEATAVRTLTTGDVRRVSYSFPNGQSLGVTATGKLGAPFELRVFGDKGYESLRFADSFTAFRSALAAFTEQVRTGREMIPREETLAVVRCIEQGLN